MWEHEHSVETAATAAAVWRHWSDVAAWPQWNEGIESITINGPFAVGTAFTMTPPGDEPVSMRLTEIVEGELFTDEADGGRLRRANDSPSSARGRRSHEDRLPDRDHRPGR